MIPSLARAESLASHLATRVERVANESNQAGCSSQQRHLRAGQCQPKRNGSVALRAGAWTGLRERAGTRQAGPRTLASRRCSFIAASLFRYFARASANIQSVQL
eukprot:scaffold10325_cov123-Isochrysis_galbana.AAC.2